MDFLFWLIPLVIAVIAAIVLVVLIIRKFPRLRVIDTTTMPKERARKVKEQIIMQRLDRMGKERLGKVGKAVGGGVKAASKVGRRAVQRLYRLERYYQQLKKASETGMSKLSPEAERQLLEEADRFTREEEYIQAEKRYVELISHRPKKVEVYERLGNMYLRAKNLLQARETLAFAYKLAPRNASVNMSLAELELAEDNHERALGYLKTCVEIRPKNPKYLDAYVQTALKTKNEVDARKGIALLKKVNPQNTKIAQFEADLKSILPEKGETGE